MRKSYRKGTVHPTPPLITDQLSFLPATILTLTAALSPEDRELLAYLISCSSTSFAGNRTTNSRAATATNNNNNTTSAAKYGGADHPTCFGCYCFRCYMSYWVRWDSSPNRQLIHEIIDAFEEGLLVQSKKEKNKKERKKIRGSTNGSADFKGSDHRLGGDDRSGDHSVTNVEDNSSNSGGGAGSEDGGDDDDFEKGSVRRFVNFLGEKIWSVLA